MKTQLKGVVPALSATVFAVGAAHASPVTAQDLIANYAAIVIGNADVSSETEKTLLVGGNLSTQNSYPVNGDGETVDLPVAGQPNVTAELVVLGQVFGGANPNQRPVLQNGQALLATPGDSVSIQPGSSTFSIGTPGFTAQDLGGVFTDLSAALDALTNQGVTYDNSDRNSASFTSSGSGIAVYDITFNELNLNNGVSFTTNGLPTIINVRGEFANFSSSFGVENADDFSNVLFNFVDADEVMISKTFNASILAPVAKVTFTSDLKGSLIAGSMDQKAQIVGDYLFNPDVLPDPDPVPLPAPLVLFATGLAGLFGLRRRR